MDNVPISLRIISHLLIYISKGGGPGELGQCLAMLKTVDPVAHGACESVLQGMRANGWDI